MSVGCPPGSGVSVRSARWRWCAFWFTVCETARRPDKQQQADDRNAVGEESPGRGRPRPWKPVDRPQLGGNYVGRTRIAVTDQQKGPEAERIAFRVLALVVLLAFVPLVGLAFWSFRVCWLVSVISRRG